MCSIRTDLLKQENEKIEFVDLSRLQFTSDESEFIPDYIQTPMMKNIENLTCIFVKKNLEM